MDDQDKVYENHFERPEQLMEIFEALEEKNLFLIQQVQDSEQALEQKKQQFIKNKRQIEGELGKLSEAGNLVNQRMTKAQEETTSLQQQQQSENYKEISDEAEREIYTLLLEILSIDKTKNSRNFS